MEGNFYYIVWSYPGKEIAKLGVPPALDGSIPEVPATLVIIDRSLDMMAPVTHGDSFMERLMRGVSQQKQQGKTKAVGQGHQTSTEQSMYDGHCILKAVLGKLIHVVA